MSFNNLSGQLMTDSNGVTYIISDTFSVLYPGEQEPSVYEWRDLTSLRVGDGTITISTSDNTYNIKADAFESRKQFLSAKAIAVSGAAEAKVPYSSDVELLPDKGLYISRDIPDNAVFATGEYSIKDIKSSLLLLLIGKAGRILWCVGILGGLLALLILHLTIGFNETNWWYLLIGGFFCGVGAVALVYIVMMIIAKLKYAAVLSSYAKHNDTVTFAVCSEGFSVCESDIYSPNDIIRWNIKDTYIETGSMYIITGKSHSVIWIPKSLFTREDQNRISDLLALNLSEK